MNLAQTINAMINPVGSTIGVFTALVVYDLALSKSFTGTVVTSGSTYTINWTAPPVVTPGANNLQIVATVQNIGAVTGPLNITITETATGKVLQGYTTPSLTPGALSGTQYNGAMPPSPYQITLSVNP